MIRADTNMLQRAIKIATLTVGRDPYILLEAAEGVLTISGFDGIIQSKTKMNIEGDENWSIVVQSALLSATQFSFDKDDTVLKRTDTKLILSCGGSKASLPEYAGTVMPDVKFPTEWTTLPFSEAKRFANLYAFCGDEESGQNKYKSGVYLSLESGIAMVTDMMSAARLSLSAKGNGFAIVPRTTMNMVARIIDDDAQVVVGRNKVYFKIGDTWITSPVIDATSWPAAAFDKFFGTAYTSRVTLNRQELVDILVSCVKFNKFSSQDVAILESTDANVHIRSFPSEMGELDRDIESVVEGQFKIGVRPESLLSGLEKIKAETIALEILPTAVRFVSEEFGYICMLRSI